MFRKYGHSLGPDSLEFLEELLDRHEINDEEVEFSVEWMAKEYNKQDGTAALSIAWGFLTCSRRTDEGFPRCPATGLRDLPKWRG